LPWSKLGFGVHPTSAIVKYSWDGDAGKWDAGVESADPKVEVHLLSHVINFGQAVFEGLKAFHTADGRVVAFNLRCNAARLGRSAERMSLPRVPEHVFIEAVERAVRANVDFLPPYGSGGSMYIRPVLFGHGPSLAIAPAPTFTFAVAVTPVAAFFEGGLKGIKALVRTDVDRAAPRGTGGHKVAGNYSPDIRTSAQTHERGYDVSLFLDSKTLTHVEEFSVANFVGVTRDGTIVSPQTPSILPSCTRKVVMTMAADLGLKAEERPIPWEEVPTLAEVAACGTAVVLTPMKSITREDTAEHIEFAGHATLQRMYDHVVATQTGVVPDAHGLLHEISLN